MRMRAERGRGLPLRYAKILARGNGPAQAAAGLAQEVTRRKLLRLLQAAGGLPWIGAGAQTTDGRAEERPGSPAPESYPVRFVDVGKQAGLTHTVYYGEVGTSDYISEANGCGVAFYDYDRDGWLDILVLNGLRRSGIPEGELPTNRLYRNNRDGTFEDVTKEAGLVRTGWANGVCIGDFDNDGHDDLFITYRGANVLYRNNGDGTFSDVTAEAGVAGDPRLWSTGCTFVDINRNGHLDLFVANYIGIESLARLPPKGRTKWKGVPVAYGPQGLAEAHHILYRNNGDGTFTEISEQSQIRDAKGYGLTAMATDFNGDGWPDIYVACDSSASILYRNNHDGTFSDTAVQRGLAYSPDGAAQAGMGLAIGDYTTDGKLDFAKTHFADDIPGLYRNDGQDYFTDEAVPAGLQASTRHLEWGVGFVDFDSDGLADLLVVTGSVYPEVEAVNPDYPYRGPRFLFRNLGNGRFANVSEACGPGLTQRHSSRGCAFGDFDNDGDMDILVMNMNEPPSLIRADCASGHHWLKVKLLGVRSNRTAIGARVYVRAGRLLQVREVHSQDSYLSVSDLRLHFGLGPSARADLLRIVWPAGETEDIRDVEADQVVYVQEGSGVVRTQRFEAQAGPGGTGTA